MNQYRLLSIIRGVEPACVCQVADILLEEGITCLEVSLSQPQQGLDCLRALKARFSPQQLHVGAGTVSQPEQVDALQALGIPFFVTPGFDGPLVDYALAAGLQVMPGVFTPSDVQQAANRGLSLVKLFPAGTLPLGYVKDLKGPFPGMDFLAVGGVGPDNMGDYYQAGFCGVGIGSSLVPRGAGPKDFARIRQTAQKCVAARQKAFG